MYWVVLNKARLAPRFHGVTAVDVTVLIALFTLFGRGNGLGLHTSPSQLVPPLCIIVSRIKTPWFILLERDVHSTKW